MFNTAECKRSIHWFPPGILSCSDLTTVQSSDKILLLKNYFICGIIKLLFFRGFIVSNVDCLPAFLPSPSWCLFSTSLTEKLCASNLVLFSGWKQQSTTHGRGTPSPDAPSVETHHHRCGSWTGRRRRCVPPFPREPCPSHSSARHATHRNTTSTRRQTNRASNLGGFKRNGLAYAKTNK